MPHATLGATMRVLRPAPHILGFYDGRLPGVRAFSAEPNWLDDGGYALGACSYAIVDGAEALIYDTHMSVEHATIVRRTVEAMGVRRLRVVLSHWHADHVAGNAAFADCPIIANRATAAILVEQKEALESDNPPIRPLVMPTEIFDDRLDLQVGARAVQLRCFDIHTRDATVLFLPGDGTLLPGDALEDPVTYVTEPGRLAHHLQDLDRLSRLPIIRILPNHGAPDVIAAGGYGPSLLAANRRYVDALIHRRDDPTLATSTLRDVMGEDFAAAHIHYFADYEAIHRSNVERVQAAQAE